MFDTLDPRYRTRRHELRRAPWNIPVATFAALILVSCYSQAETGHEAWLRYAALDKSAARQYQALPNSVVVLGDSAPLTNARSELIRGVKGMLGKTLRFENGPPRGKAIILGTVVELRRAMPEFSARNLTRDTFQLATTHGPRCHCLAITSDTDRGVLYGVFALLGKIARLETVMPINEVQSPGAPIRWADQWDNLNGTIERGYAGPSIFFEKGNVRSDLSRVRDYARLLASVGINGCNINNVNADPKILETVFVSQLVQIANVFRPWGIQLSVSVDFSSPQKIGKLDTFDPLDPRVVDWWRQKADELYRAIPDFGGFVVKADSEGRLGPASYGRSPADAANVIARALKPHGGIIFYRAFVYSHHLDWTNSNNDRGRAAYDIFHPLDGQFDDNVIIQIKHGPIDFQVREPVSPLLAGLEKTNEAIELQITQEYTGQQRHLCFLAPMWKQVLDFDLHATANNTPVKELLSGRVFRRPIGGYVGVVNVGMDTDWLGHPLAIANLYAFGRLAWNPDVSAEQVAEEWTRMTFGNQPVVVQTVSRMQLASWPIYEDYTGPLGAGTLTNILGSHYGPGIESSEHNGWGQWHRADHGGMGMDRTLATGTGYIGQYAPSVANRYESLQTTPDELLLFFHHVPYTYLLHSGKTVIQHIYDSHYEGAAKASDFVRQWKSLEGRVDGERFTATLARLEYQAGHAIVWRDAVCNWFLRTSGIPDANGRVGDHPDRIEAEAMQLRGYQAIEVVPWENTSGGKGVECRLAGGCAGWFHFDRQDGHYDVDIQYFDQNNGESKFRLLVNDKLVEEWVANGRLPATTPGGDSSTRRHIAGLALGSGDQIRIEGIPGGEERAPFDYVEIHPSMR